MQRQKQIETWLTTLYPGHRFELAAASADASFRRYFRTHMPDGSTRIIMDAPPSHEDCKPFIQIAEMFLAAGVHVPRVFAQDLTQGFLLLDDLGSTTYLQALNPSDADTLYRDAISALIKIQLSSRCDVLPNYDEALLRREMQLFPEWYLNKHLGISLSAPQTALVEKTFTMLEANALSQGQVYVHRDYHARNLMVCDNNPGVLDFQDAVYGPITYDLVSLFKDAYISWEEEVVLDWVVRYWQAARDAGLPVNEDFGEFYRDFEWMGVQRHLKVLGIFARLYHRDGKDGYLKDMPLVMNYLRKACDRYNALRPFLRLLDELEDRQPETGLTF